MASPVQSKYRPSHSNQAGEISQAIGSDRKDHGPEGQGQESPEEGFTCQVWKEQNELREAPFEHWSRKLSQSPQEAEDREIL
jgi:hypothetical protein